MSVEYWQQVEELFHQVLPLTAEERAAYLAQVCADNAALRVEVESLLTALDSCPEFLENPIVSYGLQVLAEATPTVSKVGWQIGNYTILELLGRGGMGEVYLAEDNRLARKVALKFLSDTLLDDDWAKGQFTKEAQAIARLKHPNICTVYDFVECDGHRFFVMEYLEGKTLASLIGSGGLAAAQVPQLASQIANALAEAHKADILHRDIKPQNIMVTAAGKAIVLDFGLATSVRQNQSAETDNPIASQSSQADRVVGTIAYMSPEQLRAESLDFRSDLFSFGIVLYEMLCGSNPYAQGSKEEIRIEYFQRTIDANPSHAPAYAALADCYILSQTVAYGVAKPAEAKNKARYTCGSLVAAVAPHRLGGLHRQVSLT